MRLFVFNPWHDEALAADTPYYTPTKAARLIEERERDIMRRWMTEDDILLHSSLPPSGGTGGGLAWDSIESIEPWGWDKLLRHRLRQMGAPERLLPNDKYLNRLRELSSRATSCELLRRIRSKVPETIGEACMCRTIEDAINAVARFGEAVLKAPWSCSGRGVFRAKGKLDGRELNRAQKILREQGIIAIERYIPDGRDFAMLFDYRDGCAHYIGLSVFETSPDGTYLRNLRGSEEELLQHLSPPKETFHSVRAAIEEELPRLLGTSYSGPLGIDMLLSNAKIYPAMEINLRRTMGMMGH